jgi:hypothetical protein
MAHYDPENPSSLDELMAQADILMYEEKKNKNVNVVKPRTKTSEA